MGSGWISRIRDSLVEMFVPAACAGCGGALRRGGAGRLCTACTGAIPRLQEPWCHACALPARERESLSSQGLCAHCQNGRNFQVARAYGVHDGLLREFITRLKYSGERKLAAPLGALLADAAQELLTLPEYDVIVPVPLFRDRLRERGFNQAFLLARPLALLARIPVVHGLERIVNTTAQVGLHGAARRQNVRDAFALHPRRRSEVVRRTVLLVDDVITTGATADECARVLKAAGCKRVDVIGLARTP